MADEGLIAAALSGISDGIFKGLEMKRRREAQNRQFELQERQLNLQEQRAMRQERRSQAQEERAAKRFQTQVLGAGLEIDERGEVFEPEDVKIRRQQEAKLQAKGAELDIDLKKARIAQVKAATEKRIQDDIKRSMKKPQAKDFKPVQMRAAGFARRAELAEEQLEKFIEEDPFIDQASVIGGALNTKVFGLGVPEGFKPESLKRLNNIKEQFVMASLRPETGAAITETEFERQETALFPQPGDGPDVIKQKKIARQQVIANLKAEAGQAMDLFPQKKSSDGGKKPSAAKPVNQAKIQKGEELLKKLPPGDPRIQKIKDKLTKLRGQ